jgi:putative addiction module killer protein
MQIQSTLAFKEWIANLRDRQGRAKILTRIRRLEDGNPGVSKGVGEGVMEMKLSFGPGYRVYYVHRDTVVIVLLCGGDKSTQSKDIERAKALAREIHEE